MARAFTIVLLLTACGSDAAPVADGGPADAPQQLPDATAFPDAGVVTFPKPCGDLYAQDLLPTFEVTMAQAEWNGLVDEFANWQAREAAGLPLKPYHPLTEFRYGTETVADAQIRLKGNPCCSWFGPKMQFVISFNETNPDGRFHGLRKIALDAPYYDPTFLRNRLALAYLRDLGLPASCANNARLNVNGAYYGLFTSIEHMDKEFLQRNFAEPDGNLYKYGQELKTNESIGDVSRKDQWWGTLDVAELDALSDLDEVVAEWAAEAMIPHADGYFAGSINYYMYDHPSRGFLFIPWDLDYTFEMAPVDADPITFRAPWGGNIPHFDAVVGDPFWHGRYVAALQAALAVYDPAALDALVVEWAAQVAGAVNADPNLPFSIADHQNGVGALRGYLAPRAQFVADWLVCESGGGTDGDGDGVTWCLDCNDADNTVYPGAPEVCNGVDDDCTGIPDDSDLCPDCTDMLDGAGTRFSFCTRERSWFAADTNCTGLGGELAVPVDAAEQAFLSGTTAMLGVHDEWWTGANDQTTEDAWQDTAGTPLTFLPWAPGRPNGGVNENCAQIQTSLAGEWNDRDCVAPRPSICRLP